MKIYIKNFNKKHSGTSRNFQPYFVNSRLLGSIERQSKTSDMRRHDPSKKGRILEIRNGLIILDWRRHVQ